MSPAVSAKSVSGRAGLAWTFVQLALHAPSLAAAQGAQPVATTSLISLLQVLFGLGLVLAAIAGTAWLLRRLAPGQVAAAGALRVVGGVAVGPKERVILVDVGDTRLVLGVAPGRVSKLHELPRPAEDALRQESGAAETFAARFRSLLSKRGLPDAR